MHIIMYQHSQTHNADACKSIYQCTQNTQMYANACRNWKQTEKRQSGIIDVSMKRWQISLISFTGN